MGAMASYWPPVGIHSIGTEDLFSGTVAVTGPTTLSGSPPAGYKWRIIGMEIDPSNASLAALGKITINLNETPGGSSFSDTHDILLPVTGTLWTQHPLIVSFGPTGIRATNVASQIAVTLSANLDAGSIKITIWGWFEK